MTWQDVLDEVLACKIVVHLDTLDVYRFDPPRKRYVRLRHNDNTKSGRRRVVLNGYHADGRRHTMTVYLHKLVWVFVHRRLPNGPIDHKDLDRMNNRPDNLQETTWLESNRQGLQQQERSMSLGEAGEFFDDLARRREDW